MIQYILSYRCIMDPTTVCLDGCPHLQMGAAFLYALLQSSFLLQRQKSVSTGVDSGRADPYCMPHPG